MRSGKPMHYAPKSLFGRMNFMEKVLIFGAGGFVGNYLAKEFLTNGYSVSGSDIADAVNLPEGVTYFKGDLMDSRQVEELILSQQPQIIVNLAAISSVGASWSIPQTTISVNVVGALNILEAARKCEKAPKVLFVGSSEEYEAIDTPMDESTPLNANNPYGISKMTQENFAKLYRDRYGMKVYCVRPFNHTGVGQRDSFVLPSFCKQAAQIEKSGKPGVIKVGNLAAERDFSSVKDIVRAYRMIVESDDCTKVYNVGSGMAYSLQKMLEYIVSLCSVQVTVEVDPERFRPVDTPVVCCDHSAITRELGWTPEYSIFDVLKEMFEDFCQN